MVSGGLSLTVVSGVLSLTVVSGGLSLTLVSGGPLLGCGARLSHRGGSFVAEQGLYSPWRSLVAACRLIICGVPAQPPRGMWALPGPGIEPTSLHWQLDFLPLARKVARKALQL